MHKLIILISFLFSIQLHAKEVWRIASLEWGPYSTMSLTDQGKAIDLLRKKLAKHNIELKVDFFPWKRAQIKGLEKKYVGYFPAWPEEVQPGFVSSGKVLNSNISLIGLEKFKDHNLNSISEFEEHRIGYVKTYNYPELIENAFKTFPTSFVPVQNERSLIRMLKRGRFDYVIDDHSVIEYTKKIHNINLKTFYKKIIDRPLVLALRNQPDNYSRIKLIRKILNEKDFKLKVPYKKISLMN